MSPTAPRNAAPNGMKRRAIVDIGSNSLRLVVYDGSARMPDIVHNEKVAARLGHALAETGAIDEAARARALAACRRFKALLDAMGVDDVTTVATAAARDATNGAAFLAEVALTGLTPRLLSGEEEAAAAADGVLSGFPDGDGVVADLGGGSLELVDIAGGTRTRQASYPLGVLRLPALGARRGGLKSAAQTLLKGGGWRNAAHARAIYLVGGSWRALAHLEIHLTASPLPAIHGHCIDRARLPMLRAAIDSLGPRQLRDIPGISSGRVPMLGDAATLLGILASHLDAECLVISALGLREGLLYQRLDAAGRAADPLLAATGYYARRHGDRAWDGPAVARWIAPLFADEPGRCERLRQAAAELSGVDLHSQSDTRARHGLELVLLGAWVGMGTSERAMLAQALYTAWGGKGVGPDLHRLAAAGELRRAAAWGQAIRLAIRFSGGTSRVLDLVSLTAAPGVIDLAITPAHRELYGDLVQKQHVALAETVGARAIVSDA